MKQIRHTLIQQKTPMEPSELNSKLEHVFEWANKMGREGRLVGHLDLQPTTITCIEYITTDDYTLMLNSGKIKENTLDSQGKEKEAYQAEKQPDEKEGLQNSNTGN